MPISMQGAWFVKVKSKSASFSQRYIISGASSGNGTYNGLTSTPEVLVTGGAWNISIQHDPGSGYLNSTMKLQYPQVNGGEYKFDLQSNDTGSDEDFNDLVLTFRTPVTDQDYVVYGNISYYKGCLLNPCYRIIVIDTRLKLKEALRNTSILNAVKNYYPSLVDSVSFNPQPEPPGDPFKPIMIPFGGPAIPEKEEVVTISKANEISIKADKKSKVEAVKYSYNALRSSTTRKANSADLSTEISTANSNVFKDAARVVDRFRLNCETGPVPHALLKFQEYDRTLSELSGGSYTGDGQRENLGQVNADFFGNYIFRFQRSTSDVVGEVAGDVGSGENALVQSRPDLVITLLDQFDSNTGLFETAPYWNIPFLKRINLCIPKEKSGVIPTACTGNHILQGVGNVALAAEVGGNRVGFNNYLNSQGVITAFDSLAPGVRCAAWHGKLKLRGCLKNPEIKYYTLEFRKGFGPWLPFNQTLRLPRIFGSLNVSALVNRTFTPSGGLPIDGYLNVETDSGLWLEAFKNIKADIRTSAFENGTHTFRIQGYKGDGTKFASAKEEIKLYLHNSTTTVDIDSNVTLGGATLGDCALFTLPVDGSGTVIENAPITIRFKVEHNPDGSSPFGFINGYAMSMSRGATGDFGLNVPVVNANFVGVGVLDGVVNRGRDYLHIDNLSCNTRFKGTVNEVSADPSGYYTVTVQPASGGWLETDQNFCAFGIHLGGTLRLTDGASGYPDFRATGVLIGIERPQP
ncbi:hypothetical protein [Maribacter halichondriae]|uniref:hypothetical protein n=1 Tax=Maribacter halichondriae TaxID=2980554 RepID=UPI0023592C19|nr:hypothetical protein [Maribacter sp. Hal144]